MSKYKELHEGTKALYDQAILQTNLGQLINIAIFADDNSKEIFKLVKANELLKFRTQDDLIILVNEKIIDQLTPEQRLIVVQESLAGVSYDTEKDKLVIETPDFMAHTNILRKYSFEVIDVIRESIKSILLAEKQQKDETKSITEKAKK
jgi:TRAP-type mannitol/chloroaromatic compound transport system substrate-binding protein